MSLGLGLAVGSLVAAVCNSLILVRERRRVREGMRDVAAGRAVWIPPGGSWNFTLEVGPEEDGKTVARLVPDDPS